MANLSNLNNKFLVTTGGDVLINKTAANNSTVGTQIMSTGDVNATVSGDTVARFNRLGTDGEIIRFQHDTAHDGSINCLSGRIAIGSSNTGIFFDSIRQVITPWDITDNDNEFNNISLGRDIVRFKDLYLSGIVDAGSTIYTAESLRFDGTGLNATDKKLYSPADGELQWFTHDLAGAHAFSVSHQGTRRVYLNTSGNSYFTGGNVGIGTTSPLGSSKLHVSSANGTAYTSNAQLRVSGGATNNNRATILFSDDALSDGKLSYYPASGTSAYFSLSARGTEADFIVKADGNVGIGYTSPSYKLDVNGTLRMTSSYHQNVNFTNTPTFQIGTDSYSSGFFVYDSTAAQYRMVVKSSTGNVGIGTVSPGSKLHVKGDFVSIEDPSGGFKMELSADTDPVTIMSDNLTGAAYGQIAFVAGNGSGANDQERMRIDSSGRVGIGTTGLTRQLEVNTSGGWNNGISLNSSSGDGAGLRLNCSDTGGNEWYLISTGSGNGGGAGNLGFYNNTAGAYHMYITSGGKVGIGTTSPQVPLHVKSASSSETVRVQGANATGNNYLTFADSLGNIDAYIGLGSGADDRFLIVNFSDSPTYFYNKNGIKMTITNVGNVGIGTTSPNEILTVAGNVNITGTGTLLRWNSGDIQIRNAGSYAMAFDTYSGSALVERMRIVSGGYIGMNTSPSGFATLEIENIASTTYGLYVDYIDTNASYGAMKVILTGASTSPSYVDWWYGATQTGAVVTTGSSTQYLTSSDYRLKENIVPMSNAIDRVKQLKPSRFNFIGHENTVDGLIAHEVAEVVPEAVNGEKDGLRDDGTPKYQGIDEGKLVPLLIGAIQELEARLKELENK